MSNLFLSKVERERSKFVELLFKTNLNKKVYPSKHFFERVVERGLYSVDILEMLIPVLHEYRTTTFNDRTFCIRLKQHKMVACIKMGAISGERIIVLKTIFDKEVDEKDFDVVVTI